MHPVATLRIAGEVEPHRDCNIGEEGGPSEGDTPELLRGGAGIDRQQQPLAGGK